MSKPCHDKPVNRVAQWAGGGQAQLMSVGRAESVSIFKCILHLHDTYHNAFSILKVSVR